MVKGRGKSARVAAASSPRSAPSDPPLDNTYLRQSLVTDAYTPCFDEEHRKQLRESVHASSKTLGLSKHHFKALREGNFPKSGTRAEYEAVVEAYGTPDELFERLMVLIEENADDPEEAEDYRERFSPASRRATLANTGYGTPFSAETPETFVTATKRLLKNAKNSPDPTTAASVVNASCARLDPWHLMRIVRISLKTFPDSAEVYGRLYGVGSRMGKSPQSPERVARARGLSQKEVEKAKVEFARIVDVHEEELLRTSAVVAGRRYLWPDEKGNGA